MQLLLSYLAHPLPPHVRPIALAGRSSGPEGTWKKPLPPWPWGEVEERRQTYWLARAAALGWEGQSGADACVARGCLREWAPARATRRHRARPRRRGAVAWRSPTSRAFLRHGRSYLGDERLGDGRRRPGDGDGIEHAAVTQADDQTGP